VEDVHADVLQMPPAIAIVIDASTPAKLKPVTVTSALPLRGLFGPRVADDTAASYVYSPIRVPVDEPTVMNTSCIATVSASAVQLTEDIDVHEREEHATLPIESVAVPSKKAKKSPVTVTDAAPLAGALRTTFESTGTSKEKRRKPVPRTAPMVTKVAELSIGLDPPELQATDVTLDHAEVRHTNSSKRVVPVTSLLPKFRPDTEIQDPPDDGMLDAGTEDTTALSKVRSYAPVPVKAATVTGR